MSDQPKPHSDANTRGVEQQARAVLSRWFSHETVGINTADIAGPIQTTVHYTGGKDYSSSGGKANMYSQGSVIRDLGPYRYESVYFNFVLDGHRCFVRYDVATDRIASEHIEVLLGEKTQATMIRNYSEVLWSLARQLGADLGGYSRRPHDFRILTMIQWLARPIAL